MKNDLIYRLWKIDSYQEYFPAELSFYQEHYSDFSEQELIETIENIRRIKISELEIIVTSNKITYLRAWCKKFNIKGYTKMTIEQLKQHRDDAVLEMIKFVKAI